MSINNINPGITIPAKNTAKPFRPTDPASQTDCFSGDSEIPECFIKGPFSIPVSAFKSPQLKNPELPQATFFKPQSPFKISPQERIDSVCKVASGLSGDKDFLESPIIDPHAFFPDETGMTQIVIHVEQDPHLKLYLKTAAERLKPQLPLNMASMQQELTFLKQLNREINQQFDWKRFSLHAGGYPGFVKERLLGDSMRQGVGVCRHRALLTKLTLDALNHDEIETSVKRGIIKINYLPEDSRFRKNFCPHVWNTVMFPSGRKYLVDAINNIVLPLSNQKAPIRLEPKAEKLRAAYAGWEHMFKHGNPDFKK
jgi:hypothetical protein